MRYLFTLLLITTISIGCAAGYEMTPDDCYDDEYFDEVDQACYLLCEQDGTCGDNPGFLSWLADLVFGGFVGDEEAEEPFITYAVSGDQISDPELSDVGDDSAEYQDDTDRHASMWREFTSLIPRAQRSMITTYGIFTDGEEGTMAFVHPNDDDPTTWTIALDIIDADDKQEHTHTLLHEFAHVLTLGNAQVPMNADAYFSEEGDGVYEEAVDACPTHFTGEGCAKPQSYINLFFEKFWSDIIDEHAEMAGDEDALEAFYEDRQDEFVSDYAATNPYEDIAESWTSFILEAKPTGNRIADEKVRFFYDFPEQVALREEILTRLYTQSRDRN